MNDLLLKLHELNPWLSYIVAAMGSLVLGLLLFWIIFKLLNVLQKKYPAVFREQIIEQLKLPTKFLLPLLFTHASFSLLGISSFWQKVLETLIIINSTWLIIAFLEGIEQVLRDQFYIDENNADDRDVLTQIKYLKRIIYMFIGLLSLAIILYNIPAAREIGNKLFASAGIVGIIVGIAAQKPIGNLITGFQVAFSNTIKINDQVVIEGEYGVVEDITLTNVIVKVWDYRRLILPMSHFNDHSFFNRTYESDELISSVFFYVDYTFPVIKLREQLNQLLIDNKFWDGNVAALVVTNMDRETMELRATFSSKDSADAWNLSCQIREKLVEYIQQNYPESLPQKRHQEKKVQ